MTTDTPDTPTTDPARAERAEATLAAIRAAARVLLNELDYNGYCSLPDQQARATLRALLDAAPETTTR